MVVVLLAAAGVVAAVRGGFVASEVAAVDPLEGPVMRLPLDRYLLDARELSRLDHARLVAVERCMAAKGFTDWRAPDEAPTFLPENERRYGAVRAQLAEAYGYHPPILGSAVNQRAELREQDRSLGEEAAIALHGPSPDDPGCVGTGAADVGYDAYLEADDVVVDLAARSFDELLTFADPEADRANVEWRDCMRSQGHDYANPVDAAADPAWWDGDNDVPSDHERAVASADVSCKEQVGLVDRWAAAEGRTQERLIAEHEAELQEVRAIADRSLQQADALLGG